MLRILRSPLVPICLIAVGAFAMVTGHSNAVKFAALRDHGKTVKAHVTHLDWKERKITRGDSTYIAHVRFSTADGTEVQGEIGIATDLGRRLRSNPDQQSMTVRYLPESPGTMDDINKDDSSEAQQVVGRWILLAGLAMLAVGYFFARSRAR